MDTPRIKHKIIRSSRYNNAADAIARVISEKAFEHLLAPLLAEETRFAEEMYNQILSDIGISPARVLRLHEAGIVDITDQIRIEVRDSHGNEHRITSHYEEPGKFLEGITRRYIPYVNSAAFDRASILLKAIEDMQDKAGDLRLTLRDQIENRSTKEVIAEWPEAANIVIEQMKLKVEPMVKPLDVILAKYLPALPAPKEHA